MLIKLICIIVGVIGIFCSSLLIHAGLLEIKSKEKLHGFFMFVFSIAILIIATTIIVLPFVQGQTELVVDRAFSDEYRLQLICPKCGSNWNLIPDEFVKEEDNWRSNLNRRKETRNATTK